MGDAVCVSSNHPLVFADSLQAHAMLPHLGAGASVGIEVHNILRLVCS